VSPQFHQRVAEHACPHLGKSLGPLMPANDAVCLFCKPTRYPLNTIHAERREPCKFEVSGDPACLVDGLLHTGCFGAVRDTQNQFQPSVSGLALRIYKSTWRGWWLNLGVNSALLCGFARKKHSACAFCTLHQDRGVRALFGRHVLENFVGKCTIFDGFSVKMCQKLVYFGKFDPGLSKNMKNTPFSHIFKQIVVKFHGFCWNFPCICT